MVTQDLLLQAIEITENTIVITDTLGQILWCNPAYSKTVGLPHEELIGKNPKIFASGLHDKTFYKALWDTILGGSTWRGEMHNKTQSGVPFVLELTINPVKSKNNEITHFIGVGQNITAKKELEMTLIQNDRLTSLGHLASGVAHEINNPLAVMSASLEIILDFLGKEKNLDPKQFEIIQTLIASSQESLLRAKTIVKDLTFLSQEPTTTAALIDIHQVIDSTISVLWNVIKVKAPLTKSYGEIPKVLGDEVKLGQVLLNIIMNAAESMDKLKYKSNHLEIKTELSPNSQVKISVRDTGVGMSQETLDKIFNPFYKFNVNRVGRGLGLTIAHKIIQEMKGTIKVSSEPHVGTLFEILIPSAK
ncbi:MAG: hypothetical protein BroJett040_11440 [Oligoflexia bacterium]|nr:MAG: hypothetical protein BroJett040_11440 [Oligoflexia bacterium]